MRFTIEIKSTPEERFSDEWQNRVEHVINELNLEILGVWGGTGVGPWASEDGLSSDNGWEVDVPEGTDIEMVSDLLEQAGGRPAEIWEAEES